MAAVKIDKGKLEFFRESVLSWARSNLRDFPWRKTSDPYVILITEKLLQQTDFGHVRKLWQDFFEKFPDPRSLAEVPVSEIERTIRPLGLWRQRARQLKAIAQIIVERHGGRVPCELTELKRLPGVGDYVARATLIFACGKPTYLLDVNTRRVVKRFFYRSEDVPDAVVVTALESVTPRDPGECKIFYWGLIDFSSLICSRKPKCQRCPLRGMCSMHG